MNTGAARSQLVLVVDDDFGIRDYLTQVLETEGYLVVAATNGLEALTYLRGENQVPCLILLDLAMPIMNGWDFRDAQSAEPKLSAIPVVALTADGRGREKAAGLGLVEYLQKPITITSLLDIVARHCGPDSSSSDTVA